MALSQAVAALGVLDKRALRKQLALIEARLQSLESETQTLSAQREACALLLKQAAANAVEAVAVVTPTPFAALVMGVSAAPPSLEEAIRRLLATQVAGLTADEIFDELKMRGFALPRHRPVKEVYSVLEKSALFLEAGEGRWVLQAQPATSR